ncbi:uncharacterized protein LOC136034561 isoform X2 [Artemia franciscana]|uniref:Uncharacterized protein n=1 Tax=Artemia franciscana TaxID=6661 RepID=A0AA88LI61_ARTSF|nr:hypothetical protein QYM36_002974 [Artemia franciscana]
MMEKQKLENEDSDSISTISAKDFSPLTRAPSYISEAPPVYRKHKSAAAQIAKTISWTVVAVAFILGGSIIFAAWIQASASCTAKTSVNEKVAAEPIAEPQSLVQNSISEDPNESSEEKIVETVILEEDPLNILNQIPEKNLRINRMPLEFLFDDLFADMSENNHRANMNCFVEKKKTDEMEEQAAKDLLLPFGLNFTTDPKFIRTTGEKMMVVCESGSDHINSRGPSMPYLPFEGPLPGPLPIMVGPMPFSFNGPIPQEPMRPNHPPQIPIEIVREIVNESPVKVQGDGPAQFLRHPPPPPVHMPQRPVSDRRANGRAMIFDQPAVAMRPPMEEQKRFPQPTGRAISGELNLHLTPPKPHFAESQLRPQARRMSMDELPPLPMHQQIFPPQPVFAPPHQQMRNARASVDRTPNEPHFIQPRSADVKKRQKRCSCDCAC